MRDSISEFAQRMRRSWWAVPSKKLKFRWRNVTLPCCGYFLRGGVKQIAIFNSLLAVTNALVFVAPIVNHWPGNLTDAKKYSANTFFGVYYLYWFSEFYWSFRLYQASKQHDPRGCRIWLRCQLVVYSIFFTCWTIHCSFLTGMPMILIQMALAGAVGTVYKIYSWWVVCCFLRQLKQNGREINKIIQRLPDQILEDFHAGHKTIGEFNFRYQPYDSDLEIDLQRLTEYLRIGSGAQSIVYRALYINPDDDRGQFREVAVKVTRKCEFDYFQGQLKDLKTRIHIGQHRNIVGLIGACTKNIRDLELQIVLEFCSLGSLESFLIARRGLFHNQVDINGELLQSVNSITSVSSLMFESVNTLDLLQWALQAAEGLSYLHSKHIIHNDVATRNMLITREKVLKITDFGLSVPIGSTGCAKSKQTYVPLLWMAPETLNNLPHLECLSVKSDAWSYGVALWEMFTLCMQPNLEWSCGAYDSSEYCGFQRFSRKLSVGALKRPGFAPVKVYEIMKNCWRYERNKRSTLEDIMPELSLVIASYKLSSKLDYFTLPLTHYPKASNPTSASSTPPPSYVTFCTKFMPKYADEKDNFLFHHV